MFKELFDLGPKECGPICLNTMGFDVNIIKNMISIEKVYDDIIKNEINKYISYVSINEPSRIYSTNTDELVEIFSIYYNNELNTTEIIDNLIKLLDNRCCTIIGYSRRVGVGHVIIVAKSDTGKLYIFNPQEKKSYKGNREIENFLNKENIEELFFYSGNIKLRPPKEYSQSLKERYINHLKIDNHQLIADKILRKFKYLIPMENH